jgi:hypothetical protein
VYKTRAPACSPSFSPRFHHDNWDSGNYAIDAVDPGRPYDSIVRDRVLSFAAPGADLLCGTATRYEVVTSKRPITPENFAAAKPLAGAPAPASGRDASVVQPSRGSRALHRDPRAQRRRQHRAAGGHAGGVSSGLRLGGIALVVALR